MWIWWIISLIILIACVIFAYRMIVSSYEFLPVERRYFWKPARDSSSGAPPPVARDTINSIKRKVQSVEENTTFYQIQFNKFQERLKALEDLTISREAVEAITKAKRQVAEEDWKELYFEENEKKEKLENELDATRQMLEAAENKLKESGWYGRKWEKLQENNDQNVRAAEDLQRQIAQLQEELNAATAREKELEHLLMSEITIREKYTVLRGEYQELQHQSEALKKNIEDVIRKDEDLELQIIRLNELESKLALCEEDKSKLKASLLRIIGSK